MISKHEGLQRHLSNDDSAAPPPFTGSNKHSEIPIIKPTDRVNSVINILKGVEEYTLDLNGVIVSSNLEAVTITGYEEWEVIGRHFSIFYSTEDQVTRAYERDLEKAQRNGFCISTGLKLKKRNSPFWAKCKFKTQVDDSNKVVYYRLTIQDATLKVVYSHNLNLVKDEYLNLFNNPFIGIFKLRIPDFKFVLVNEKAESFLGKEWSTLHLGSFFSDQSVFHNLTEKLKSDKKVENFECEVFTHKGNKVWISVSCKLFPTVGIVEGAMIDITDRRKEEEKTRNLNNELESFIYHASHDLRSPLTSIYGLVNLLNRESMDEKVKHYANLIEGRLRHLDGILSDIVEIAYNSVAPVTSEQIKFEDEVTSLLATFAKSYPAVYSSLQVNHFVPFYSDCARIKAILRNILSNSFKYSNPLLEKPFVRIFIDVNESQATISIEDNGIGIAPDHTEKVFSLFYRATDNLKGNGLGLYITKSMVSALGGDITFKTSIGEGTTFKIVIPSSKIIGDVPTA